MGLPRVLIAMDTTSTNRCQLLSTIDINIGNASLDIITFRFVLNPWTMLLALGSEQLGVVH